MKGRRRFGAAIDLPYKYEKRYKWGMEMSSPSADF